MDRLNFDRHSMQRSTVALPKSAVVASHPEDIAGITASIKSTLQAQGSFGAIRAQLRSCVYGALIGKLPPPAKQVASTPEARLALGLISEFFEFHGFQSTLLTAASEVFDWDNRLPPANLADALQLTPPLAATAAEPLLVQLMKGRIRQSAPATVAEDIGSTTLAPPAASAHPAKPSSAPTAQPMRPPPPGGTGVGSPLAAGTHAPETTVVTAAPLTNHPSLESTEGVEPLQLDALRSRAADSKREEAWVRQETARRQAEAAAEAARKAEEAEAARRAMLEEAEKARKADEARQKAAAEEVHRIPSVRCPRPHDAPHPLALRPARPLLQPVRPFLSLSRSVPCPYRTDGCAAGGAQGG